MGYDEKGMMSCTGPSSAQQKIYRLERARAETPETEHPNKQKPNTAKNLKKTKTNHNNKRKLK